MKQVEIGPDGARMGYVEFPGRAPARIFLHGLGSSAPAYFARIAADPALAGHRSIMLDLLGFGLSDRPARFGYALPDHAAAVAAALDRLDIRGADVIGHSMGGAIAIILATERPDLVRRLVAAEPSLMATRRPRLEGYSEDTFAVEGFDKALAAVGPAWAATMRLADRRALYRSERALGEGMIATVKSMLLALAMPRTVIMGSRTPVAAAERELIAAGIPLVRIADAGHNMMLDNPSAFTDALVQALA